jgi:hypothetical protein
MEKLESDDLRLVPAIVAEFEHRDGVVTPRIINLDRLGAARQLADWMKAPSYKEAEELSAKYRPSRPRRAPGRE